MDQDIKARDGTRMIIKGGSISHMGTKTSDNISMRDSYNPTARACTSRSMEPSVDGSGDEIVKQSHQILKDTMAE